MSVRDRARAARPNGATSHTTSETTMKAAAIPMPPVTRSSASDAAPNAAVPSMASSAPSEPRQQVEQRRADDQSRRGSGAEHRGDAERGHVEQTTLDSESRISSRDRDFHAPRGALSPRLSAFRPGPGGIAFALERCMRPLRLSTSVVAIVLGISCSAHQPDQLPVSVRHQGRRETASPVPLA